MFAKQGPKLALLSASPDKEPPLRDGVHIRTAAVVEPAAGRREKSAAWLVSASYVGSAPTEARSPGCRP